MKSRKLVEEVGRKRKVSVDAVGPFVRGYVRNNGGIMMKLSGNIRNRLQICSVSWVSGTLLNLFL